MGDRRFGSKAGTPQEKKGWGLRIKGQGGSATKPGPSPQNFRLTLF